MTKENYTQEQREKFISQLKEIVATGKNWNTILTNDAYRKVKKYEELIRFINNETPLLQTGEYTINTKVYWILNGLTDFPRCQNPKCNKPMKKNVRVQFDGHKGYAKFCSYRCASSDEEVQAKLKATCQERYGYDNGSKVPEVIERIKRIQFNRNGGLWDFQTERFREQAKDWCMRNYGVENYVQTDECRQKYIHTMMERYGVEHYSMTDEFKQKFHETVMKRYGGYPFLFNPNRSEGEIQLFDYIRTIVPLSIEMLANDRTQMTPNERNNWRANHELDIWIPQLKIAIEYQGSFWHNPLRFPKKAYNDKEK